MFTISFQYLIQYSQHHVNSKKMRYEKTKFHILPKNLSCHKYLVMECNYATTVLL